MRHRHTFAPLVLAAAGLLLVPGCGGRPDGAGEDEAARSDTALTYSGCGITRVAFMEELATAYNRETEVTVNISGGGATKGIRGAAAGSIDMGGGCRHKLAGPEERQAYLNMVAWDALAAIVHPSNPVAGLSARQLRSILVGEITNWREVGGADAPITVLARTGKISGVGRMARELIFGDPAVDYAPSALIYPSSGPLEQAVETMETAIGVTGVSSARKREVKILSISGVYPDYENIANGNYPFFRPLYLYTQGPPTGKTKAFIDFAVSPVGQSVIKAQGTVTLEDGSALLPLYERRMQELGVAGELWRAAG